jgi:hypothetical protein
MLRDAHVLPKLLSYGNPADVTDSKPIAVCSESISSVSVINPLVAFSDCKEKRQMCYFLLSRTPQGTCIIEYLSFLFPFSHVFIICADAHGNESRLAKFQLSALVIYDADILVVKPAIAGRRFVINFIRSVCM